MNEATVNYEYIESLLRYFPEESQGDCEKSQSADITAGLTLRRLMSYIYIYGAPILDVSRSHTTTQHSR